MNTSLLLNDLIKHNNLVNGYIFFGQSITTLQQAAFYLVESYFSQKTPFKVTPSQLENCPDLIFFTTENSAIKVDDVSYIQNRIKYGPSLYNRFFVLINDADLFTPQAANAFLKTLEEPLENISFILLTTKFPQLLPTIRSRCQHLHISKHDHFDSTFSLSTDTDVDSQLMSYTEFLNSDKINQFNYVELISKNKLSAKEQIDFWIKNLFDEKNFSDMPTLLDIRFRLEFNVNTRLQLEQLIL